MSIPPGFEVRVDARAVVDRAVAREIVELTTARAPRGLRTVLGLASGQTPRGVYQELVGAAEAGRLDPSHLVTFNLDEYFGLEPDHPTSFRQWMHRALFDPLGLAPEQIHFPRGDVSRAEVDAHCLEYEAAIAEAGGIDLQILGLGTNGHIGFNEPGSAVDSRTRLVQLSRSTRAANAGSFPPGEVVPEQAITMGVGTILEARRIVMVAYGASKAGIVQRVVRGPIGAGVPATWLRRHPDAVLCLSPTSAAELD